MTCFDQCHSALSSAAATRIPDVAAIRNFGKNNGCHNVAMGPGPLAPYTLCVYSIRKFGTAP